MVAMTTPAWTPATARTTQATMPTTTTTITTTQEGTTMATQGRKKKATQTRIEPLPGALGLAGLVADAVIAHASPHALAPRFAVALAATGAVLATSRRSAEELGITRRVEPHRQYWWRAVSWLVLGMSAVTSAGLAIQSRLGRSPDVLWRFESLREFVAVWVLQFCLVIPLLEELLYRFVLFAVINSLAPRASERSKILTSGVSFAALHLLYGNFSAESLVGGFVLAWAFSKSRSLLMPLALHAGGNLALGSIHLAATAWG